jgi:hypothetical protein
VACHISLSGADAAAEENLGVEAGVQDRERGVEVAFLSPAAKDMLLCSVSQDDFPEPNVSQKRKEGLLCPFIQLGEQMG